MSREDEHQQGVLLDIGKTAENYQVLLYLLDEKNFGERGFHLPSRLDLAWCTSSMAQLLHERRPVYIRDAVERQTMLNQLATNVNRWGRRPRLAEALEKHINAQTAGERLSIIYYGGVDKQIWRTPVNHGTYASVYSPVISNVLLGGNIPLLCLHTHPVDNLFSAQDYFPLIASMYSISSSPPDNMVRRVLSGSLVLGPHIQILSLATSKTPLLSFEEAQAFIEQTKREMFAEFEDRVIMTLEHDDRQAPTDEMVYQILLNHADRFAVFMDQLHEDHLAGRIDEFGRENQLLQFLKSCGPMGQEAAAVMNHRHAIAERVKNEQHVALARLLNLRLFSSRNMRDFVEFTA